MSRHTPRLSRALLVLIALMLSTASAMAQASAPYNVHTYGATGAANCTLDTAGVLAAVAAVPSTGGEVYFPAGTYCMTQSIVVVDKSIAFRGEGQNTSILRYDAGNDGIAYTSTSTTTRTTLTVKSLSIVSNKSGANAAISGSWAASGSDLPPAASITDFEIRTTGHSTTMWAFGLYLGNASRSVITNINLDGINPDTGAAIRFFGQTLEAFVSHGAINFWYDGIEYLDHSEGLHVADVEVVGTKHGVWMDGSGGVGGPGTSIANCHFNTSETGIYSNIHGAIAITGNLFFSSSYSVPFPYAGIYMLNSTDVRITGNSFELLGGASANYGIIFDGTMSRNIIANNQTNNMTIGIVLNSGVTSTLVIGNLNPGAGTPISNAGTGNNLVSNF